MPDAIRPVDPLTLEVRRLCGLVAELAEEQYRLQRRLLHADDRAIAAVIVPLAGEVMGPAAFAPGELMQACIVRRDAVGQALLEAVRAGDLLDSDGGYRSLGRVFRRVQGAAFDGYRLVADGTRWRVLAVSSR